MNCVCLALVASLVVAGTVTAASLREEFSPHGYLILTNLDSSPFPHPQRAEGHTYKGVVFPAAKHYSNNAVAIFVPTGLEKSDRVDVVVHFHGWRNTVPGVLRQYRLIEQLAASGRKAVLVVPQGPFNAPDSFGGKLEDSGGFARFMGDVAKAMDTEGCLAGRQPRIGRIILSGHSGGYRVIAAILDRGGMTESVEEVWLFDALYAGTESYLAWWDKHRGRLLNIYTDGGGTKDETEGLMARLKTRGTPFFSGEEPTATAEQLRVNRLIFLHTDLGHNEVLDKRQTFERFLKASRLSADTLEH